MRNIGLWGLLLAFFVGISDSQSFGQTLPPIDWSLTYGGSALDYKTAVAVDGQGSAYVAGYTSSNDFPVSNNGQPSGGFDITAAKFDSSGNRLWAVRSGSPGNDYGFSIGYDMNGNTILAGTCQSLGFPATDSSFSGTGEDLFVTKLDTGGAVMWTVRYGGSGNDEALGVAVSPQGEVYVTGQTESADFPITSSGNSGTGSDAFVIKLGANGTRIWAQKIGGTSFDISRAIALRGNGFLVVAGETGSSDFPVTDTSFGNAGAVDAFSTAYDTAGTLLWSRKYGGSGVDRATSVATGFDARIVISGYTESADFPVSHPGYPGGGRDAFVLELDSLGNRNMAFKYGGPQSDQAQGVAFDATGAILVAGETSGAGVEVTTSQSNGASQDAFVARFLPGGELAWGMRYGGQSNEFSWDIASGPASGVWLVGQTQSQDFPISDSTWEGGGTNGFLTRLTNCEGMIADFGAEEACDGQPIIFQDSSSAGNAGIDTWNWDFGDGNSSTTASPQHTYSAPGSFQVLLEVTNVCGEKDSSTQVVNVFSQPTADFDIDGNCVSSPVSFNSTSTVDSLSGSSITSWNWDFGDSISGIGEQTTHIYADTGTYIINLVTTTDSGCTATTSDTVRINATPVSQPIVSSICEGELVQLTDSSAVVGDSISGYFWDFGDGGTDSTQMPTYIWDSTGTYGISLIVETPAGCADTAIRQVTVHPKPMASFSGFQSCDGVPLEFSDSSTVANDSLASWFWDFGDSSTSSIQNPVHLFPASGPYQVSLEAVSAKGCADTAVLTVDIFPRPSAGFSSPPVCLPGALIATDTSYGDSIVSWHWDFGDGATDTVQSPTHEYLLLDTFYLQLVVGTGNACFDTLNQDVVVHPKPSAYFVAPPACEGDAVQFIDSSSAPMDSLVAWNWSFGDGIFDQSMHPSHAYSTPGEYLVTLVAETFNGCTDTLSDSVFIWMSPQAQFHVDTVCQGTPSAFTNQSQSQDSIVVYSYSFGDGNASMTASPSHVFDSAGQYSVLLVVGTDRGCADSVQGNAVVLGLPNPEIVSSGPLDVCEGGQVSLSLADSHESSLWSTGDTASTITLVDTGGVFSVLVADSNGCTDADTVQVVYHAIPQPNPIVSPGPTATVCSGNILLLDAGDGYSSYAWNTGDTTRSIAVDSSGSFMVMVTNGVGCLDSSASVTVAVLSSPAQPTITTVGDTLFSSQALAYQWMNDSVPILGATNPFFVPVGSGDYSVVVSDSIGCTAQSSPVSFVVGFYDEVEFLLMPQVWPNPSRGEFWVSASWEKPQSVNFSMYDLLGHRILNWSSPTRVHEIREKVFVSDYCGKGVYILEIEIDEVKTHHRVIIE